MRLFPLVFACALLVLAGCDSVREVPGNVRERFTGPAYNSRTVPADQRKTYDAARDALTKMSFRFTHGGPAQGKIEAISALVPGESMSDAHQTSVDIKLSPSVDGGTEIAVLFSEIASDQFNKRAAMGTTTPMHDTPLYEVFYHYLTEALAARK